MLQGIAGFLFKTLLDYIFNRVTKEIKDAEQANKDKQEREHHNEQEKTDIAQDKASAQTRDEQVAVGSKILKGW